MNLPNEAGSARPDAADPVERRAPRQLSDLQKTITMAQIAKAAGVSQGAISSLLNDRDYGIRVSEKTRERVFKVCREMGYIPNDLRAVVRMYPELGDFCLLLSSTIEGGLFDPFVHRLVAAAMGAVPDAAHLLSLAYYDETQDYSAPNTLPHPIRVGTYSKFLTYGVPSPSLLDALFRRGLPVVSLGYDAPQPGVTSILPDYTQAAALAIEHLVQLGHQHLGIISGAFGSTHPKVLELNHGVSVAFEKFGLHIEGQHIVYGDLSEQAGRTAMEEFLTRKPAPTAIFALSDRAALGALSVAQARGLKVPEDLSIVGCSDDSASATAQPALTTIHLPAEEMAAQGIREIDRLVNVGVADAPRKESVPVRLVSRASTGSAATLQKV
ncbi:MAG TPA: LacI family DNA-binding transcriptional regulator [Chthoniobacter sp.]|nr:LacI family DNA-binding transcriptional regulator [Chthoniobacter sp.]